MKKNGVVMMMIGAFALSGCANMDFSGICCDGGYEYRHPNAWEKELQRLKDELAAAQRQLSDRDAELAVLRSSAGGSTLLAASELAKSQARSSDLEKQLANRDAELARLSAELAASQQQLAQVKLGLGKALKAEIDKGNITLDLNSDRLLIRLASTMLFESGEDELNPAGVDVMNRVGAVLKGYPEYKTEVSGHTDDVKIVGKLKEKFPTNMELSQARADHTLQQLRKGGLPADNSSAVGFADTKPIASNATEEGQQKNRRVEIQLTQK